MRVFFALVGMFLSAGLSFAAERLVVFTPSSLGDVLSEIAMAYENRSGQKIVLSIAGTSQLARQLEAGAPADIFMSADRRWMDWAIDKSLIDEKSQVSFASNRLVLAVRSETENWADPKALLTQFPFAMGEPDSVPAGHYAREALRAKGWWSEAKSHAVYGENVRVALRRVVLGEVGAAIVYGSDIAVEPGVKSLLVFPSDSHTAIAYIVAQTENAKTGAGDFISFLTTPAAGAIFARAGFLPSQEER
ncbi:MAG: molybdate ABC transporter substrate-binding protein [Rhizobiaceae bacterium]